MYAGKDNIIIYFSTMTVLAFLSLFISCASNPIRNGGIIAETVIDEYVGSKDCAECHIDKYDDWSQSLMTVARAASAWGPLRMPSNSRC